MSVPSTPRHRDAGAPIIPSTPATTHRLASSTATASPHYSTTRRHSLYGTEDRIILDPGSRVWKAGFSGEGRPRDVFFVAGSSSSSSSGGWEREREREQEESTLWTLARPNRDAEGEEKERMLKIRLQARLRDVFHRCLLTDPKSRKVIIVEHPLLPLYIKEMMAEILFENLQIPSLSFAPSHLLALFAVGRMTGLVLDCGYLQSTALPIFSSRPLFPQMRTTPLAGSRFTSHLRALLLLFGTYIAPSPSGPANVPSTSRAMRVPEEVLSDGVMEQIKTQCCFVGAVMDSEQEDDEDSDRAETPLPGVDAMDADDVPSSEVSESRMGSDIVDTPASPPSSQVSGPSSFSAVTGLRSFTTSASRSRGGGGSATTSEGHLQAIAEMYGRHSTATELRLRVDPPGSQAQVAGVTVVKGTLVVPGWIRERAAEVFFEGGDIDESSVAEVILDSLLKVPVDLRKLLASSILVVGGAAMLAGFIPRLHGELVRLLTRSPSGSGRGDDGRAGRRPRYDPYAPLRALGRHIAILNNPSPGEPGTNAGKAPAFTPACLPWVGGSLAGAMKIGGVEVAREKWDEATLVDDEEDEEARGEKRGGKLSLPDWTRSALPVGAPACRVVRSGAVPVVQ